MARRAGSWLAFVFLMIVGVAGCNGSPSHFNGVVLQSSATTVGPLQLVTITATVPADSTNAGVTWTFAPGLGAPANPGSFTSTPTYADYTSPTSVTTKFTVTMTATSVALPSQSGSVTITVTPPPPLAVQTTALPSGVENAAYAGAQLQATGGVAPYTWTIASGSLPPGLSLSTGGFVSGTPTSTGTFTVTVQVTDNEPTPMTATSTLSIAITNLLNGSYAFEFSGFQAGGQVVVAGSFTTDGISKITAGVEDVNSIAGTPKTQTFTGTYTLGGDDRGQLVFTSVPGSPTYAFAIDSTGAHGRMIEFDSTGVDGSGELARQSVSTCSYNTLSGSGTAGNDWVIGLTGTEANIGGATAGPFALAGRFTAEVPANSSTPGTLDHAEVDASAPGDRIITKDDTFSGSFQTSAQADRCTMSVTMTLSNMSFAVYPVSSSKGVLTEAYVVETNALTATTPFLSVGKLIHQTGYPFTQSYQSLSGASVGGLSGSVLPSGQTSFVPFAAVIRMQPSGGTGVTFSEVDNVGGTVQTNLGTNALATNFNIGDSFGRVSTTLLNSTSLSQLDPVFYVIAPDEAVCLLENQNAPVLGVFEPQSSGGSSGFSAGTLAGTFTLGTASPPMAGLPNFSGVIALVSQNGSGVVSGTEDFSTSSAHTPGLAISGTYALTASGATDGSGTLSLTQSPPPPHLNGAWFIVSPTKAVMITTTSADANPVLIILGDQSDDFGVN